MTASEDLLTHLWKEVININLRDSSLDNIVAHCKRDPTGPFGDTGRPSNAYLPPEPPGATYAW